MVVAVVLWQTGVIRTGFHVKVVNVYPHRPDDPRRPIAPAGPSCALGVYAAALRVPPTHWTSY